MIDSIIVLTNKQILGEFELWRPEIISAFVLDNTLRFSLNFRGKIKGAFVPFSSFLSLFGVF